MRSITDRLFGHYVSGKGAVGLLGLRLLAGSALIQHGLPKIKSPLHWMDAMSGDKHVPSVLQASSALAEVGGGLLLMLGLLTPVAAAAVVANMLAALSLVHVPKGDPFVGQPGQSSAEPAALYLTLAAMLGLAGPGTLSLDALIFGKRHRLEGRVRQALHALRELEHRF